MTVRFTCPQLKEQLLKIDELLVKVHSSAEHSNEKGPTGISLTWSLQKQEFAAIFVALELTNSFRFAIAWRLFFQCLKGKVTECMILSHR